MFRDRRLVVIALFAAGFVILGWLDVPAWWRVGPARSLRPLASLVVASLFWTAAGISAYLLIPAERRTRSWSRWRFAFLAGWVYAAATTPLLFDQAIYEAAFGAGAAMGRSPTWPRRGSGALVGSSAAAGPDVGIPSVSPPDCRPTSDEAPRSRQRGR
jgi:hypothetical protein